MPWLALFWAWLDPGGAYELDLSGWQPQSTAEPLIEGQLLRAVHAGTGGGLVLRDLDLAELQDIRARRLKNVDLAGALSGDRLARVVAEEQEDAGTTVYVGPGQAPHTGRWVYVPGDGRVWWQVFWQSGERYHQLMAWAPRERFADFSGAMKALETGIHSEAQAPETLLFDANRADCGAGLHADRSLAMQSSRRFEDAQEVLLTRFEAYTAAGGEDPGAALGLAELRALGLLYRLTESCVHTAARQLRACRVYEGEVRGGPSEALQEGVVRCLDAEEGVAEAVDLAIGPFLPVEGSP